jgi:hypothetical protein
VGGLETVWEARITCGSAGDCVGGQDNVWEDWRISW